MLVPQTRASKLWEARVLLGMCLWRGLVPVPEVWRQGKETFNLCLFFVMEKPELVPR